MEQKLPESALLRKRPALPQPDGGSDPRFRRCLSAHCCGRDPLFRSRTADAPALPPMPESALLRKRPALPQPNRGSDPRFRGPLGVDGQGQQPLTAGAKRPEQRELLLLPGRELLRP